MDRCEQTCGETVKEDAEVQHLFVVAEKQKHSGFSRLFFTWEHLAKKHQNKQTKKSNLLTPNNKSFY